MQKKKSYAIILGTSFQYLKSTGFYLLGGFYHFIIHIIKNNTRFPDAFNYLSSITSEPVIEDTI